MKRSFVTILIVISNAALCTAQNFTQISPLFVPNDWETMNEWVDVDKDGDLDILVFRINNSDKAHNCIKLLENNHDPLGHH